MEMYDCKDSTVKTHFTTPTNEEFLNIRIKLGLNHREFAKYCGVTKS